MTFDSSSFLVPRILISRLRLFSIKAELLKSSSPKPSAHVQKRGSGVLFVSAAKRAPAPALVCDGFARARLGLP